MTSHHITSWYHISHHLPSHPFDYFDSIRIPSDGAPAWPPVVLKEMECTIFPTTGSKSRKASFSCSRCFLAINYYQFLSSSIDQNQKDKFWTVKWTWPLEYLWIVPCNKIERPISGLQTLSYIPQSLASLMSHLHFVSALQRLAALPLLLTCRGSRKTWACHPSHLASFVYLFLQGFVLIYSYDSSSSLKTMTMCDQEPLQPFTSRRVARSPPSPSWGLRSSAILSDPALTCFERIQKPIQIRNISKLCQQFDAIPDLLTLHICNQSSSNLVSCDALHVQTATSLTGHLQRGGEA